VRIDHFRGFDEYWAVPCGEETAVRGSWKKGPGINIFKALEDALGKLPIIAEDLGFMTQSVRDLRAATGFPGMKVMQFGFDHRTMESEHLPHNYEKDYVAYLGTHDNSTIMGWLDTVSLADAGMSKAYCGLNEEEGNNWGFLRMLFASPADTVITAMQDILALNDSFRMNIPSTLGGNNWQFRIIPEDLNDEFANRLHLITKIYSRL
jgi:4-alpha-glucanotransferase